MAYKRSLVAVGGSDKNLNIKVFLGSLSNNSLKMGR